jgi:uncharacterized cupin superfamily protein
MLPRGESPESLASKLLHSDQAEASFGVSDPPTMKRCKIDALPWEEQRSPSGKFHSFCRNISMAIGATRNLGTWGGGHPFDVQIRRVPPGAAVCPFHSHLVQWELFVVLAGSGTLRAGHETHAVKTDDVFVHPPGEAHQLSNTGSTDLEVMIIADNPQFDACYYPDSDKWSMRPGKVFRMQPVEYFTGEDDATTMDEPADRPSTVADAPSITPFSQRKASIADLPWAAYDSPKKKFHTSGKQLSFAVGAKDKTPIGLGGHPFDLELGKVTPGLTANPYHSHAAQWEFFIFRAGRGEVRTAAGDFEVGTGDVVLHPPGEAHQFRNTGTEDLHYFLVADNPPLDLFHYPDSGKWGHSAPRKIFRATDADYWDGEE